MESTTELAQGASDDAGKTQQTSEYIHQELGNLEQLGDVSTDSQPQSLTTQKDIPVTKAVSSRVRLWAVFATVFGVLWLSPDSLLVRFYKSGVVPQLMYKNMFFSLAILIFLLIWQKPRKLCQLYRARMKSVFLQGVMFTLTQYLFTLSIINTAAATTLALLAASPLFSALISRVVLGEKLSLSTLFAVIFGFVGVLIVFVGNIAVENEDAAHEDAAHENRNDIVGVICGVGAGISLAAYFVFCRFLSQRYPQHGEELMLAGLSVCSPNFIIVALCANQYTLASADDWGWAAIQGGVVAPVSFAILAIGPSYLLASEVGLIQLLETVTGPLWVWMAGYEAPPVLTAIGGTVLLSTLCIYFTYEMCCQKKSAHVSTAERDYSADLESSAAGDGANAMPS